MKNLILALLVVSAAAANAQIKETWSVPHIEAGQISKTLGTAVTPNGNTLVLSVMGNMDVRLTRFDGQGNKMWSYRHAGANLNLARPYNVTSDSSGNAIVTFGETGGLAQMVKVGENGSLAWEKELALQYGVFKVALDSQDNAILLTQCAWSAGGLGTSVSKHSASGQTLGYAQLSTGYPSGMSVAGNGRIFLTYYHFNNTSKIVSLTPNLTTEWYEGWWNTSPQGQLPCWPAADRNGKLVVAEIDAVNRFHVNLRTFTNEGAVTLTKLSMPHALKDIYITFDANGKLVMATESTTGVVDVKWLTITPTSAVVNNSASYPTANGMDMQSLITDAFGRSYVSGSLLTTPSQGQIAAFDEVQATPAWTFTDGVGNLGVEKQVFAAVGRWGQVSLATTIGGAFEGVNGIRQNGLRNLTINGYSFTGGRTITGTVNFYGSDDEHNRTVNLTSNSSYAVVTPSATVNAGLSQTGMSIQLKPTTIRRAVRIEGTFAGVKRMAYFYIEPPVAASVTLFPISTKGGTVVNATARLNGNAPIGGIVATLESNNPAASVPGSVTIAANEISKGFKVTTMQVSQTTAATISMTANAVTKTATLTITP